MKINKKKQKFINRKKKEKPNKLVFQTIQAFPLLS